MASGDKSKSLRQHRESHVEKIRQSMVLDRLIKHAMGTIEMSATQVAAAKVLLDRYLPVVKSVEIEAEISGRIPTADPFYKADPEEWRQSAGDHNQGHSTH